MIQDAFVFDHILVPEGEIVKIILGYHANGYGDNIANGYGDNIVDNSVLRVYTWEQYIDIRSLQVFCTKKETDDETFI